MNNRRATLKILCIGPAAATMALAQHLFAAEDYADRDAADQWVQKWIKANTPPDAGQPASEKPAHGVLRVARFADPMYYLTGAITWDPPVRLSATYPRVTAPVGFVTDFASIPRIAWSLLRPDGLYTWAAVIHDYLYWEQFTDKEQADTIFKLAMEEFEVPARQALPIYNGVVRGGDAAWKSNARLKAAGERRILKRTPQIPTVTWAAWKREPDVFL